MEKDFLGDIEQFFGESKLKPEQYSALGLAYIGDCVYDLIIRTIVIDLGNGKVKNFHRITSSIVKATSQAKLMKVIMEDLTQEEEAVYRHGRNTKSATLLFPIPFLQVLMLVASHVSNINIQSMLQIPLLRDNRQSKHF